MVVVTLLTIFGALWRRWLGGWRPFGNDMPRAVKYAVLLAVVGPALWYLGASPIIAAIVAMALCVGFSIEHGNWMDMGTMPHNNDGYLDKFMEKLPLLKPGSVVYDCIAFAIHYSITTAIVALLLNKNYYALAGILPAISYLIFSKFQPKYKSDFVDSWTAYGELALGAALIGGTGIALAI